MTLETILVEFCDLELSKEEQWKPIVDALESNCSLTNLSVKGNEFSEQFMKLKDSEM